ncbi:ankyrin repeat domain-containing protein [Kitasatospora viridis]|uniref:Uncharacterized protein n=1 Tax=Kitasatospora viridis TaxID=281105 RepID=A0A561S9J7_9ACTN|nr:ankyrin repeat domain-containing protein [Kitasatospora viridis]TWF71534.1 hypothetical protein FHX73_19164 [Kitasatospora viridis]
MADWYGVADRDVYSERFLAERDALADAAYRGDWHAVLTAVDATPELANSRRVGGRSGWTPLHQAAFHGAPVAVAEQLLAAGAWRTIRAVDGERPVDIATRLGHHQLVPLLRPAPRHEVADGDLRAMEHFLHALIRVRTESMGITARLLPPQVSVLGELPDARLHFAVPGMYGGFTTELKADQVQLEVRSFCRVAGGSGQTHRITPEECALIENGWG